MLPVSLERVIFRPNKVNTTKKNPMKEQELKKDHLLPGHMVSADHYISRAPGRLYHTKGKSDNSDMFSGGCVFIDHTSGYVSIKHQVAINATETVKAKLTFEREAQSKGVGGTRRISRLMKTWLQNIYVSNFTNVLYNILYIRNPTLDPDSIVHFRWPKSMDDVTL